MSSQLLPIVSHPVFDHPTSGLDSQSFVDPDDLRASFTLCMSQMYKAEVPLYGDLMRIVNSINMETIRKTGNKGINPERLTLERHGAIRLGTSDELRTIRRIFALLGMYPVDYYDLSIASLPMHATCFRPVSTSSLRKNAFRVFTTLLRTDLVQSDKQDLALSLLKKRSIFSVKLKALINVAEAQGGRLRGSQAETFVVDATRIFSWQEYAAATYEEYRILKAEHPILADIACFRNPHINHLTPQTLDIDAAQREMQAEGMKVKSRIEGPPRRSCPILLRQTSFLALQESVKFLDGGGNGFVEGSHTARFGEIEERGAAVTRKGRQLYDQLLEETMQRASTAQAGSEDFNQILDFTFKKYPDAWVELRRQKLAYFEYRSVGKVSETDADINKDQTSLLETLLDEGVVEAVPITYEDFLPFSAAGIFQSNIGTSEAKQETSPEPRGDRNGFEAALGCQLLDADELYRDAQYRSLKQCAAALGLGELDLLY